MKSPESIVNVMVPTGALGSGVRQFDLERGIDIGAHVIAVDAGSTDSGPAYLATGLCKYARSAVKSDLRKLLAAQARAQIPLLVGSCGTSGCDAAVEWTYDIVLELVAELGIAPRIARVYSEQDKASLARRENDGRIRPLAPFDALPGVALERCDHIVALMGPEPYVEMLSRGFDVILGGRTTDTAVIAALPLHLGAGAGPAWHAGKIAECGGVCTVDSEGGGVMVRIGADHFEIEPLDPENACTPASVSAHMLYENADPFRLLEPGGTLDVTEARYEAIDSRRVRVTGSRWIEAPYTLKLEGAGRSGFQTITIVGIRDRRVLADPDRFLARLEATLRERVESALGTRAGTYDISLRAYGWNGVSALPPSQLRDPPGELGVLFVATAQTQALATEIAKTCNFALLHLPAESGVEMPSYAFPFSPAETERGPCYDFHLNHVVAPLTALAAVRTETGYLG